MRSRSFALAGIVTLVLSFPTVVRAQSISLQTVPLASGNQFMIFPSHNSGMGGVAIALDDPLLDPFVNAAKGSRSAESFFFTAPTMYSVGENGGSVLTLPAGVFVRGTKWFGSGVGAIQQASALGDRAARRTGLSSASATNKYMFASLGRTFSNDKIALAVSAYLSDIWALDGTERLFAGSTDVTQNGSIGNFRLGALVDLGETRSLEVVALHGRVDMTHDVTYREWVWRDSASRFGDFETRNERELDVTRSWGLHAGYQQPLGEEGWRVGGILTANWKTHPKIPAYVVENVVAPIPRDPGRTWAYNIGVGLSKSVGPAERRFTFGMDVVYQPAWSHTWAEAEEIVPTASGGSIPTGGRTVDNRFVFSNVFTNVGISNQIDNVLLQFGLRVALTDYGLDQRDHVTETSRHQDEQWTEWTPTWGLHVDVGGAVLRYLGSARIGTRGALTELRVINQNAADRDVLAAPNRPVNMSIPAVWTHQFSVVLPIG